MELNRETETRLARELLGGAPEAFDRFVAHFRTKIFHYSWLMCGQREDAEEVAQEALLRVFENIRQLKEPERVRPWVFRIAKNACLTRRRKSIYAPSVELSLDELMPAKEQRDGEINFKSLIVPGCRGPTPAIRIAGRFTQRHFATSRTLPLRDSAAGHGRMSSE